MLCFCYEGSKLFVLCRQYFVKTVFFITDLDSNLKKSWNIFRLEVKRESQRLNLLSYWPIVSPSPPLPPLLPLYLHRNSSFLKWQFALWLCGPIYGTFYKTLIFEDEKKEKEKKEELLEEELEKKKSRNWKRQSTWRSLPYFRSIHPLTAEKNAFKQYGDRPTDQQTNQWTKSLIEVPART